MEKDQLNSPGGSVQPTSGNYTQPTTNVANSQPVSTIVEKEPKKEKRTGLIIGIIIGIIILLGSGTFAAFAIIKNQPDNIAAESVNNLLNAKQVGVSGTFSYTPKGDAANYVSQVTVAIEEKTVESNLSSNLNMSIMIPTLDKTIELSLGEVMLKDGVFYAKVGGITKLYEEVLSDLIDDYILSSLQQSSSYQEIIDCVSNSDQDGAAECMEAAQITETIDPATAQALNTVVPQIKSTLEGIIKKVDDQWIEFSISDILDSNLVSQNLSQSDKASIKKAYNCTVELKNNISQYSEEFSNLYSQNKFVALESSTDSFYKIKLKSAELANYIKAVPNTKAFTDYMSCNGITDTSGISESISTEEVDSFVNSIPDVYARFDGLLNHHLAELKIQSKSDIEYYEFSADLNFTYPSNLEITAPSNSLPVMDLVEEIVTDVTKLNQNLSSFQ